jgi:hypothetical protein
MASYYQFYTNPIQVRGGAWQYCDEALQLLEALLPLEAGHRKEVLQLLKALESEKIFRLERALRPLEPRQRMEVLRLLEALGLEEILRISEEALRLEEIRLEEEALRLEEEALRLEEILRLEEVLRRYNELLERIRRIFYLLSTLWQKLLDNLLFFCNFSGFPHKYRPPCTTMPWNIWPSLVVLWGVCWMFYNPLSQFGDAELQEIEAGKTLSHHLYIRWVQLTTFM